MAPPPTLQQPLHPLPLQDERRPSLWTSYINAAASHPQTVSPVSKLTSVVKKVAGSPPAWKKRKDSDRSWVELETHAVGGGGVGTSEVWDQQHVIGDDDDDEEGRKDGEGGEDEEEEDTIRFDRGGSLVGGLVVGGGASGGLLQGESRSSVHSSSSNKRTSSYGHSFNISSPSSAAYPNRNFAFADRRSSSGPKPPNPTVRSGGNPPPPTSSTPAPSLPRRQSRPPPPQATREELLQAERERRAADHRVKMQLRKEEQELEELRARNEMRSLERSIRKEAKGFQCKEKDGPPALPVRSPVYGGSENGSARKQSVSSEEVEEEDQGGSGATTPVSSSTRPRRMSTISSQKPHHSNTDDDSINVGTAPPPPVPTSPTLTHSNWTTQPLNLPPKAANRSRPPDILVSDEESQTHTSIRPSPPQPRQQQFGQPLLSPGISSNLFTYGQQQQETKRERVDEEGPNDDDERSPISPVGTYFVTYPPSSSSDSSRTSSSAAPPSGSGSPLDLVRQQVNDPQSYFPRSKTPPPPPAARLPNANTTPSPTSSRLPNLTPPTVRISLLSPTGAPIAVSRPQYYDLSPRSSRRIERAPSPSSPSPRTVVPSDLELSPTKSLGSPLQSVIDDYIHSSDDNDDDDDDDSQSQSDGSSFFSSPRHQHEEEDEQEEETRQIKRRMEFLAVEMQQSKAEKRKSSAPFAFDFDEARPVSLALPPVLEERAASYNTSSNGGGGGALDQQQQQDFRVGEGQTNDAARRPTSCMTFPRKMSRHPSLLVATADRGSLSHRSGEKEGGVGRRRSRTGGRGTSLEDCERDGGGGDEGEEEEEEEEVLDWSRRCAHFTGLFPCAMLGLLVRIGMNSLGRFEGNSVPALLWSQGIGCAMFGLVLGKREELYFFYPPLYTGLALGFSETITSYSGWMLQVFLSFSNFEENPRNRLSDAVDGLSLLFLTLLIAYSSMSFGIHLASLIPPFPFHLFHPPPPLTREIDLWATSFSLTLYLITFICYFVTENLREELTFPLLLAPAAAVVRFYLSRANPRNGRYGGEEWGLPWGTGLGNVFGTALLGALFVVQRGNLGLSGGECIAVGALSVGLAGSLTSVATLIYQARAMWKTNLWMWGYVLTTIVASQLVLVLIVGAPSWSGRVSLVGSCSTRID